MPGVEILNQTEIYADNTVGFIGGIMVVAIMAIGLAIAVEILTDGGWGLALGGMIAIFGVLFVFAWTNDTIPTDKYEYEVLIDDTVNLKEFYEKYEIIDNKGSIFTIREKE